MFEEKMIQITFSNGETWEFPAGIVAKNYADYYSKRYGEDRELLRQSILCDNEELVEWAIGDMDWKDVRSHAKKVSDPSEINYDKEWSNAKMRVKLLKVI